jgi:hypothetical protein
MTAKNISKAMARVRTLLARRPGAGIHPDEPAIVTWDEGTRVVARHANGTQITTDMPVELGGAGNEFSPRAGCSGPAWRLALQHGSRWRLPPGGSLSRVSRFGQGADRMRGASSA